MSVGGSDGTFRADARVSGPIIPGRLMGSGAILRGVRTGTVRDLNHPDHPLGGEDVIGARGQLRVVLNRRSELLVSGDTDSQRSDAALLFKDPGGQAGVSGRQPDGSSRRARVVSRGGSHVPVRRVGPPHGRPHAVNSSDEPDGLPKHGFRRSGRYRHFGTRSDRVAPRRNPTPTLRRSHCRVAGFPPDMARGPVSLRR